MVPACACLSTRPLAFGPCRPCLCQICRFPRDIVQFLKDNTHDIGTQMLRVVAEGPSEPLRRWVADNMAAAARPFDNTHRRVSALLEFIEACQRDGKDVWYDRGGAGCSSGGGQG